MIFSQPIKAQRLAAHKYRLHLILFIVALVSLTLGLAASAQTTGSIKTDLGVYVAPPTPPLPPAGGKFIDPTFGTEIMRVTDQSDGASFGTLYSNWHTFNLNNTRLLFSSASGNAHTAQFDPTTMTVVNKRPLPLLNGNTGLLQDGAAWSYTNPDLLYSVASGSQLYSLNLSNNTFTLLANFAEFTVPGLDLNANNITTMHMDAHDEVFVFRLQSRTTYGEVGYFAYRRSSNQILFYKANSDVHHILVDRSGRYVVAKYNTQIADQPNATVVDLQASPITFTDLVDGSPDEAPGGHGDVGTGTILGAAHNIDVYTFRRLSTPHDWTYTLSFGSTYYPRDPRMPGTNWMSGVHMSMLADNEGWALLGVYGCTPDLPFCNEILQVENKPNPRVRRLLHHHSVYTTYYDSPRPTISRDGKFVAFTSNWGIANGRRDLFIARITPPSPNQSSETRPRRLSGEPKRSGKPRVT